MFTLGTASHDNAGRCPISEIFLSLSYDTNLDQNYICLWPYDLTLSYSFIDLSIDMWILIFYSFIFSVENDDMLTFAC